jgi:hypothetical protein
MIFWQCLVDFLMMLGGGYQSLFGQESITFAFAYFAKIEILVTGSDIGEMASAGSWANSFALPLPLIPS